MRRRGEVVNEMSLSVSVFEEAALRVANLFLEGEMDEARGGRDGSAIHATASVSSSYPAIQLLTSLALAVGCREDEIRVEETELLGVSRLEEVEEEENCLKVLSGI